jgi:asparagine synthase (glutamine-hydrolysing)
MVADVPLGAFLSGGVDSSSVVALMAEASRLPVKTCSIGFDVGELDESQYAARIAKRFLTDHHSKTVAADDFGLVDTLAFHFDEPFADASALPTYRVSEMAREHVTVALSGDGADEAFAGYRRHVFHQGEERMRALLPQAIRGPLFGTLGRLYPKADWAPRPLRENNTALARAYRGRGLCRGCWRDPAGFARPALFPPHPAIAPWLSGRISYAPVDGRRACAQRA